MARSVNPGERANARWAPLGRALIDYHRGARRSHFVVHSDLWDDEPTPVEDYYRPGHLPIPELELRALTLCRGRVLDLGAGAGRHALELQARGLDVTAIDVCPDAVAVMRDRGVRDARCGDLDTIEGERFDTILLLMHGIGLVGTLSGLAAFLEQAQEIIADDGQIVCDSADLTIIVPSLYESGGSPIPGTERYPGEVEFRLTYGQLEGQPYPWLFVDPRTLGRFAKAAGFDFTIGARGSQGAFVAILSRGR
jgi:SAM-dependent methyltransferase